MEQPKKSRWCLYLPGHCIHSVPATHGSTQEIHLNRADLQSDFKFQPYIQPLEPIDEEHPTRSDHFSFQVSPRPATMPHHTVPSSRGPCLADIARLIAVDQAFENTSTSVAASQMRNALNNLADTVKDAEQKKVRFPCFSPRDEPH